MEKQNAKKHPEVFYCKHMYAGLAGYEDETILVNLDCMKKLSKTFDGKPVYVFHQDVDIETIEAADGWVSDCWYCEEDGWLWAKFVAVTDDAREAIESGWSVSNAYLPLEWGKGGSYTNIDYDRSIVDGQFTHLAIVPNPRYEAAEIMSADEYKSYMDELKSKRELKNSKKDKSVMKFFKNKKEEVTALDGDLDGVMVELQNGKSISVSEMVEAVENAAKKNEAEKDEKLNMDMEVEVGNEKMPVKELINKYMNMCKTNAGEEDDEKENADGVSEPSDKANASDAEDDDKENSDDADDKKEEKANSKHFDELKNAPSKHMKNSKPILSMVDGVARGKERF